MSKENRETILSEVKKIICNDRNEQYGEPEDSFEKIADYWTTYIKHNCVALGVDCDLDARDVAIMMVLFKPKIKAMMYGQIAVEIIAATLLLRT